MGFRFPDEPKKARFYRKVRRRSDPILRPFATLSPHPIEIAIENHAAAAPGAADKPVQMEYSFKRLLAFRGHGSRTRRGHGLTLIRG
jgi:hypothetical protein